MLLDLSKLLAVRMMPNPNPVQSQTFVEKQYKAQGNLKEPLSKKAIAVKLPQSLDPIVRTLPSPAAWIREAIAEKAEREGLIEKSAS